jgi:hypothetical protein
MTRKISGAYAYACLSEPDLLLFRVGGPGLGNLMFTWARALLYCAKFDATPIWPTWLQLKIGPWLRGERDKRSYGDLFLPPPRYVRGLEKAWILMNAVRFDERALDRGTPKSGVIWFKGGGNGFKDLAGGNKHLQNEFEAMFGLTTAAPRTAAPIAVHVRLGDFAPMSPIGSDTMPPNVRLPIEWYVEKVIQVRSVLGTGYAVEVFSDEAGEALHPLMSLPNVTFAARRSAAEDLRALSRSRVLIGSNSTFSQWARFLGQQPAIWYGNTDRRWPHFGLDARLDAESPLGAPLDAAWVGHTRTLMR